LKLEASCRVVSQTLVSQTLPSPSNAIVIASRFPPSPPSIAIASSHQRSKTPTSGDANTSASSLLPFSSPLLLLLASPGPRPIILWKGNSELSSQDLPSLALHTSMTGKADTPHGTGGTNMALVEAFTPHGVGGTNGKILISGKILVSGRPGPRLRHWKTRLAGMGGIKGDRSLG